MTGLVLVSHSRALALALQSMVDRLFAGKVSVAVAAGAGEGHAELGTDATAIVAAIEAFDQADNVLVLLDLGSALLSAETALVLLDEKTRARVTLCCAPLVEGALAAAAQCSIGASIADVRAEAEGALRQKIEHLQPGGTAPARAPKAVRTEDAEVTEIRDMRVENLHGIHARPAMRIVRAVAPFRSDVQIENLRTGAPAASARSLMAISCLDARAGDTIRVTVRGGDAEEVMGALAALHAEEFGELDEAVREKRESENRPIEEPGTASGGQRGGGTEGMRILQGKALSDGIAIARLVVAAREIPPLPPPSGKVDPAAEMTRLNEALVSVRTQLDRDVIETAAKFGAHNAAILQVQQVLMDDPALVGRATAFIHSVDEPLPAAHAWQRATRAVVERYHQLPDPLLRERARDVEDLEARVLRALGVDAVPTLDWVTGGEPAIFAVASPMPSEIAALHPGQVAGILAESIGGTSHAAILLRAAGIPVVDGLALEDLSGLDGSIVALDGGAGRVWLRPDDKTLAELEQRRTQYGDGEVGAGTEFEVGHLPIRLLCTRGGRRIELAANAASVADARAAARAGAEGIGLLRTEFLFLERASAPSEDEQMEALREIAGAFSPDAPVTVRTLDIGGDKPVAFLTGEPEANPFLGVRGIRLTLRCQDLFLTHLRAILRAGHGRRFRVMFPMVTDVGELRQARTLLARAHESLAADGLTHAWPVETGMMIEVPAAALNAARFAPEVDFFSVGTNDLTQYTLAAERGHSLLGDFSDALHPAVLRLVANVCGAARRCGRWVGVCGEAAADPVAAGVFVGLGVAELSVGVKALGRVREAVAELDDARARLMARRGLRAESGEAVRGLF